MVVQIKREGTGHWPSEPTSPKPMEDRKQKWNQAAQRPCAACIRHARIGEASKKQAGADARQLQALGGLSGGASACDSRSGTGPATRAQPAAAQRTISGDSCRMSGRSCWSSISAWPKSSSKEAVSSAWAGCDDACGARARGCARPSVDNSTLERKYRAKTAISHRDIEKQIVGLTPWRDRALPAMPISCEGLTAHAASVLVPAMPPARQSLQWPYSARRCSASR